jgi:NhaP-type Na+/H+ or K+/H+ antiporter
VLDFGETEGQLLTAVTFMTFGALMVPFALKHADARAWLYALASLTVLRGVPVALSLAGLRLDRATTLFLAWFGPRGIASLLYALLVVEAADLDVADDVVTVVSVTVLASVVLHGVTAAPWAKAYGARRGGGS